ncbi:MAG: hypothetical protein OXE17_00660 [Chloroflexi bacterium]|nr:hypothetical protein [Chloroflexota bacterium]
MFGIDASCGWLGVVCGMDFRSFGCAQDDMVWWGVALTPGPSPMGRGVKFGIDVGCDWLGMVCGMDFRSFGCAQDDMN